MSDIEWTKATTYTRQDQHGYMHQIVVEEGDDPVILLMLIGPGDNPHEPSIIATPDTLEEAFEESRKLGQGGHW